MIVATAIGAVALPSSAAAVTGPQYATATSPFDSTSPKTLTIACPADNSVNGKTATATCPPGTRVIGIGGDLCGFRAHTIIDDYQINPAGNTAVLTGYEDQAGNPDSWAAQVWAHGAV